MTNIEKLAERLDQHAIRYANDYGYSVATDLKNAAAALRAQPAPEGGAVREICAALCDAHATWAESKISEDAPAESAISQMWATISNTANDLAAKIRESALAPPERSEPVAWLYHKPGGSPLASTTKVDWQFAVEPLYAAPPSAGEARVKELLPDDFDLIRQWYDAVCDLSPEYLDVADHELAAKLGFPVNRNPALSPDQEVK